MQYYDVAHEFCVMRLCHIEFYTMVDHFFVNYAE